MAEEADPESKTEDPTPKRREEARKQGQIPFSNELVSAAVTLASSESGSGRASFIRSYPH